jgi:acetyl-CoA synthetase
VKSKLEAHAYPREVEFIRQMPMTKTGKILKQELREMHKQKAQSKEKS